jgi:N-acetylglucosamine-6-phosphate deacetylase
MNFPSHSQAPKLPVFDLQVNGATVFDDLQKPSVVDFSSPLLTVEEVHSVSQRLARSGVEAYLATIITSPREIVTRNVKVIVEAMKSDPHILGIHLEGPFFSKTCKGAHQEHLIIEKGEPALFAEFQEAAQGAVVLTTVSPAITRAPEFIEYLARSGVIVSLGHHDASPSQLEEAFAAGATGITHAGNGWSKIGGTHPRQIADVLTQLSADGVYVMLIPDGEHVSRDFIKYVHKVVERLRPGHTIFVSDCSPLAGAPEGQYKVFHGKEVEVSRVDGQLRGCPLSGSYLLLSECLPVLRDMGILSETQVRRAISQSPLEFMRPALERIERFPDLSPLEG